MAIDTVPVRIDSEAAKRSEELGVGDGIDEVIELAKTMISQLHSVDVTTWTDYEEGTGTFLQLIAWKDGKYVPRDPERAAWQMRIIETMPLHFRRCVVCSMYPREAASNGR